MNTLPVGVIQTATVSYPMCPFCQRPIRRPCQIAWPNDVGILVLCGGCYRLLMTLQRMAEHGVIRSVEPRSPWTGNE
jgi:hypothetical protein